MSKNPDEDRPSVLDQIKDQLTEESGTARSDNDCDECGESEGSVVHVRDWEGNADEKFLCRACFNDPEVWPDGE